MGLYDDENTGITGGAYSSLYRAMALNSAEDQSKIDADKEKSEKRMKIGGTVAGIGVVGGIVGNSLINGKLGELIKSKNKDANTDKVISVLDKDEEIETLTDEQLGQLVRGAFEKNKKK